MLGRNSWASRVLAKSSPLPLGSLTVEAWLVLRIQILPAPRSTALRTATPTPPTQKPPSGKPSEKDIDAFRDVLEPRHLDAFRRERNGEIVARKPDGTPYDHVPEVNNAIRGLENTMQSIQNKLGSPSANLTAAERQSLTDRYAAGSRLLDYARGWIK